MVATPAKSMPTTKIRFLKDKLLLWGICAFSTLTAVPLIAILFEVIAKGYRQINIDFFTKTAPSSLDALLAKISGELIPGGILNGIVGSFSMLMLSCLVAIPIGIFIGIYISENSSKKYASLLRNMADLVNGTPSIVIGMIVYACCVKPLGSYSGFAGAVALSIMMLPLIIRSTDESLRMLPGSLKEAALALGVPYYSVVLKVLLPSAFGGLFTGILLGVSRALGETAPLMLTALGAAAVQWDMSKPVSAIPLLIWEFYNDPNLINLIWSSSLFLMFIVLILNLISAKIAKKWRIQ